MMPDFATVDIGAMGRQWWRRRPLQTGQALAVGMLVGLLTVGWLAAGRLPLSTLILWTKYQAARGAAVAGLSSVKIIWLNERGAVLTTVDSLLKTPGLDAWAGSVSNQLAGTVPPALLSGFLAFLAALLWSIQREPSGPLAAKAPAPVAAAPESPPLAAEPESSPVAAKPEPHPVAVVAEKPLPVTLPHVPPPRQYSGRLLHDAPERPEALPNLAAQESRPAAHHAIRPPAPPPVPPADRIVRSYESYWGLSELPFENVPDPKFYFPAPMHEEALHRLLYGVQTRKGAVMLTGEIGCGKTLISRELSLHLSGQQYDMAMIANPSFGVEDFLTEVLYQLGIEPTKTKVKLLHLLNDRLHENYQRGRQTIIVVDEAQAIPDDHVFEELRLLLNFQLNDRFLLTLVLMGQPELNDRVTNLKQFAQRVSIKYHLGYFSAQQTADYVRFRLRAARCPREIFSEEALEIVFQQSGGIPRNINTLCDLCLLIGFMERAVGVNRAIAERAVAERGQLGLP